MWYPGVGNFFSFFFCYGCVVGYVQDDDFVVFVLVRAVSDYDLHLSSLEKVLSDVHLLTEPAKCFGACPDRVPGYRVSMCIPGYVDFTIGDPVPGTRDS